MDPDRDDAARLRRGDTAGLAGLMGRHQDRLFRYLLRLVGDEAVAEDTFQQTWLQVAERIGRFDGARPFAPWLFTVARNLALDHLRRRQPESLDEVDEPAAPGGGRDRPSRARRRAGADRTRWRPRVGGARSARPRGAVAALRGGPGPARARARPWAFRCRRPRRGSTGRSRACASGCWPRRRRRSGDERPRDRPAGARGGGRARARGGGAGRGAPSRVRGLRGRGRGVAPPRGGARAHARPAAVARPRRADGRGRRSAAGGARPSAPGTGPRSASWSRSPGRSPWWPGCWWTWCGASWRCASGARWRRPPRGTRPT